MVFTTDIGIIKELVDTIDENLDNIEFLTPIEVRYLLEFWEYKLKKQRMIVDIPNKKTLIIGDIHGDYEQFEKALTLYDNSNNNIDQIVFLGDIVDRGTDMLKVILKLISRQVLDKNIYYLRGNHEIRDINDYYGFRGYVTNYFDNQIYDLFQNGFCQLPLGIKLGKRAFLVHGGIPRETIYFHLMRLELKPKNILEGNYAQLLWNDPSNNINYFAHSPRGENFYLFGKKAFDEFMKFHELDHLIRAHQAFIEGYKWFFNERLLSIYSSKTPPYYSKVDPHFAIYHRGNIELIRAKDI